MISSGWRVSKAGANFMERWFIYDSSRVCKANFRIFPPTEIVFPHQVRLPEGVGIGDMAHYLRAKRASPFKERQTC